MDLPVSRFSGVVVMQPHRGLAEGGPIKQRTPDRRWVWTKSAEGVMADEKPKTGHPTWALLLIALIFAAPQYVMASDLQDLSEVKGTLTSIALVIVLRVLGIRGN